MRSARKFTWLNSFRRLTTRGRAVLAAGLTAVVCAYGLGQRDLLRVAVFLTVIPLLVVLLLTRMRYQLACARTISPARVPAGQSAQVTLEVVNVSSSRCGTVMAQEQVPDALGTPARFVLPGLEAGERRAVSYPVTCHTRGRYQVGPLSLTVTDPFGMGQHQRSFTSRSDVLVVPTTVELPTLALGGDWAGSGSTVSRTLGTAGTDDVTTREYQHGDDVRRVHWRSTARRGQLMVRREEQPWRSQATVLLDRRGSAYAEGSDGFEWAVRAVASVAGHLSRRGYAVKLIDGSVGVQDAVNVSSPMWSGAGQVEDAPARHALDYLATCTAGGSLELSRATRATTRTPNGLVVAVLGTVREDDPALLTRVVSPGTTAVAVVAAQRPTGRSTRPTNSASCGRQVASLQAAGWHVVVAEPDERLDATWSRLAAPSTPASAADRPSGPIPEAG
ncbi:MAG: DUF58 domain-containing protein [Angustibacter sp.]